MNAANSTLSRSAAVGVGLLLALAALLFAEFLTFPATGHRLNTEVWPPEAKAILLESPDPMTPDQWKRLRNALEPYGGPRYGQPPYWAMTATASWWWFVLLPSAALLVLRLRRVRIQVPAAVLVGLPSPLVLIAALFVVH